MRKTSLKPSIVSQEQGGKHTSPVVLSGDITIQTKGEIDILDITPDVSKLVHESGVTEGIVTVFVAGATGAITTVEFEPGVLDDVRSALQELAPKNGEYKHHLKWKDGNGHSHVRAALLGPGVTVPVRNQNVVLGQWQQIAFIELDTKPRERKLLVQIIGV